MFKSITTAAVAALPLLFAVPAQAAERVSLSAPVSWVDLDLTHPAGQAQLDRRIATAAKRLCGSTRGSSLRERADTRRCLREAMATAAPQRERVVAKATVRGRLALASGR